MYDVVNKMSMSKNNVIINCDSQVQDEIIDLFQERNYLDGVQYDGIIIDIKEVMMSLTNIRSSLKKYDESDIFHLNIIELKKMHDFLKKDIFTFFINLYEEYLAILIALKTNSFILDREHYIKRKELIEAGHLEDLASKEHLCDSVYCASRESNEFTKLVFIKNAQYIVDYNLQFAIDKFLKKNNDNFRITVLTELDYLLSHESDYNNIHVQTVSAAKVKKTP